VRQTQAQVKQRGDELAVEERRLERELADHHRELQKLAQRPNPHDDELALARFADVQERIRSVERRLSEVRNETERLRGDLIHEADVVRALAEFEPVWESLSPREQGRLLQLLIERVDYDGSDGTISITFHLSGIQSLANQKLQGDAA
jgi:site-specific DNA recombinase